MIFAAATAAVLSGILAVQSGAVIQSEVKMKGMSPMMYKNEKAVELRVDMRELWEEHVMFTREYILSALAGLEDTPAVANRLLTNQDEIGNEIAPYFGDAAGKKLTSLLRGHIMIAVEVVNAAKSGDNDALAASQAKWKANANDMALFLSNANPNWKLKDLQDMLYKHLDMTTYEVVARLKKDWKADIEAYDKGEDHMLMFADMLTNGIVLQFPKKFQ